MRILLLFLLSLLPIAAEAQTKRAFIIGVGEYLELTDLPKTENDANGYAVLFEELEFEVTTLINPSRASFSEVFGGFLSRIAEGDEVVFVFSGHGWSDGAENYLIMSDAPLQASEYQLKDETRALQNDILLELKRRNPRLVFAIIDACRNYPFESFNISATERGLLPINTYEGTLVLFSAGDRQRALERLSADDDDEHSVFTRVLLPKLRNTSRPLQEIARDVKDEVRDLASTIQHPQRPAYYDELLGDYCLSGICSAPSGLDDDTAFWINATAGRKSDDPCPGYRSYVAKFPKGKFLDQAIKLLSTSPCVDATRKITGVGFSPYDLVTHPVPGDIAKSTRLMRTFMGTFQAEGVNFSAAPGAVVVAPITGTVQSLSSTRSTSWIVPGTVTVIIEGDNGRTVALNGIGKLNVRQFDEVEAGQSIGLMPDFRDPTNEQTELKPAELTMELGIQGNPLPPYISYSP